MSDQRPKRTRWRWFLLLAILGALGAIWFWPGGDARFAGTWTMESSDGQAIGILSLKQIGLNSIRLTGTAASAAKPRYFLYWEARDGMLRFGNRPSEFRSLSGRLIHAAAKVPGATFFSGVDAFAVEDVTDDRIQLKLVRPNSVDDSARISLRRLVD